MSDTQFHLRWHFHGLTFIDMLHDLHMGRAYTDVSLVCDGGVVRAHRAVLSISSPYLSIVLGTCSENDEAPLLLPEVPVQDVRYLISFIYRGQVDVPHAHMASFLNTGKHLQILGLEQGDQLVDSPCKSDGSSSQGSEAEDDLNPCRDILGNNNKGEKREKLNGDDAKVRSLDANLLLTDSKDVPFKVEDIKVEDEALDDGRIDLNYYLQQAIQSASMPCPLCKKEFKSQSGLRDHIRLHTGERPFVCDFCHMNFARASHLKRHRRMHTGEKPFECSVCGKDFSRGDKLKDHLRRHEAEDKLHQIRKQILTLDEAPPDSDAPSPQGTPAAPAPAPAPLGSSSSPVSAPANPSFAALTPITSLTTSPAQLLLSKLSATPQESLPPPPKRLCPNPKGVMGPLTTFNQAVTQMPNILVSQAENVMPQMLGVTSIGECILRPIN